MSGPFQRKGNIKRRSARRMAKGFGGPTQSRAPIRPQRVNIWSRDSGKHDFLCGLQTLPQKENLRWSRQTESHEGGKKRGKSIKTTFHIKGSTEQGDDSSASLRIKALHGYHSWAIKQQGSQLQESSATLRELTLREKKKSFSFFLLSIWWSWLNPTESQTQSADKGRQNNDFQNNT